MNADENLTFLIGDEHRIFDALTERVIGAVLEVSNTLGAGFLERVYERALLRELGLRGIQATAQASFSVTYKGHSAGEYFADSRLGCVLYPGQSWSKTCWWCS